MAFTPMAARAGIATVSVDWTTVMSTAGTTATLELVSEPGTSVGSHAEAMWAAFGALNDLLIQARAVLNTGVLPPRSAAPRYRYGSRYGVIVRNALRVDSPPTACI